MNWLIVYQRSKGLLLRCEEHPDSQEALSKRFELEREHAGDRDLEIVVLSAETLQDVYKTHSRYFFKRPVKPSD